MIFKVNFSKGWTDRDLYRRFVEAVQAGDCSAISFAVGKQGAERPPEDADILALQSGGPTPALSATTIGSAEFDEEQKFVHDLVEMRDEKFAALPMSLPRGLRVMSPFLDGIQVKNAKNGLNFVANDKHFNHIQAGGKPLEKASYTGVKTIETMRDLAIYVHKDNPYEQWMRIIKWLCDNKVPQRLPTALHNSDSGEAARFTSWGWFKLVGIVAHGIEQASVTSFKYKWTHMIPRPEEYGPMAGFGFLPQCYPEGSPMHCSERAMHSMMVFIGGEMVRLLFDGSHKLPAYEMTVDEAVTIFEENVGLGRLAAGVHRLRDHELCRAQAKTLAKQYVDAAMRRA